MNSEVFLSCEGIERYLGEEEERVHALRGVSLEVETGSIHAVVGPSGCGKSSLLYVLGLLDLPDARRVRIESEPVSQLSDDELVHKRASSSASFFNFIF
jgi:lipoprotein-releasing system ATP-binding protein